MSDREKVITHLQIVHTWAEFARERDLNFFTAKHLEDIAQWADDALALLKEQEAVEPKVIRINDFGHPVYACGKCGLLVTESMIYCHECGKRINWEGR